MSQRDAGISFRFPLSSDTFYSTESCPQGSVLGVRVIRRAASQLKCAASPTPGWEPLMQAPEMLQSIFLNLCISLKKVAEAPLAGEGRLHAMILTRSAARGSSPPSAQCKIKMMWL